MAVLAGLALVLQHEAVGLGEAAAQHAQVRVRRSCQVLESHTTEALRYRCCIPVFPIPTEPASIRLGKVMVHHIPRACGICS
jgi:hypothetical protein